MPEDNKDDAISRRRFLQGTTVAGIIATAGCIGPLSNNSQNKGNTRDKFSHPSAQGFREQPYIGPELSKDNPIIIAFEDLSCPICKSFHNNTLQTLKEKYTQNDELTFVYRGTDFAGYPWGGTAALVQEAVYEKQPRRTFDVIEAYYQNQTTFTQSNVIAESENLLQDVGIEPQPIIDAVQNGEVNDRFKSDKTVGRKSGVRGTPTFMLFKDGFYQTTVVGAKSAVVFEDVLDL